MKSFPELSRNKETILERSAAPSSLEFPLPCSTEKQRKESTLLKQFSLQHAHGPQPRAGPLSVLHEVLPTMSDVVRIGHTAIRSGLRCPPRHHLQDAAEELSERQTEGLGQSGAKPTEPAPKRPLTFVSIPNKLNPCPSRRSRVGTIHYDSLISLGPSLFKANLKSISHIFSTRVLLYYQRDPPFYRGRPEEFPFSSFLYLV